MPQRGELVARQLLARAVDVVGQQHLVAGSQQRHVDERDRRQAARREQRLHAALERGDALLEREGGRRAVQAVGVAGLLLPVARAQRRACRRNSTVDALCTAGCTRAEAGRRPVGMGDQRRAARRGPASSWRRRRSRLRPASPTRSWPSAATMRARVNSPRLQRLRRLLRRQQADPAVDLGRVGVAAADAALPAERRRRVDQHLHRRADRRAQLARSTTCLGDRHEARAPLLAHARPAACRAARWPPRRRPANRRSSRRGRAAPREEVEQVLELGFGLAREAGDERAADDELAGRSRASAPARSRLLLGARRPLHAASGCAGCACWNGTSR